MKELKRLNYYNDGGYSDDRDMRYVSIELTSYPLLNKVDLEKMEHDIVSDIPSIYCEFKTQIGNTYIAKTFTNIEYPLLNNFVELLNKVNFEKIEHDTNITMMDDISLNKVEYTYDNCEELKVLENPKNKGLIDLLNDFLYNYLLKDNELQAIFKAIFDYHSPCNCCIGLKYIIENDKVFDINKKYELN